MKKTLAFVLGGGGSRGALQVGALRALSEAGYQPDLIAGTSIGAVNGAFLAVHGFNQQGIDKLTRAWEASVDRDLLPANLWWQMMRLFFNRPDTGPLHRVHEFAIANGLTPDLRFKDIQGFQLYIVASDLNAARPVVFGLDPQDKLLESVEASMTLPPWMAPVKAKGRYLIDGAVVSNLPVEAALRQGATEIIALDLFDYTDIDPYGDGFGDLMFRLEKTTAGREVMLEIELAEARGVPVRRVCLVGDIAVQIWDFRHSIELMASGYQIMRAAIESWDRDKTDEHAKNTNHNKPTGWWNPINLIQRFRG